MSNPQSLQLRVGVDVGTRSHSVAVGLTDGSLLEDMIRQDAERILQLNRQIKALEDEMARIAANSAIACQLAPIPGYGSVCSAELAGEIGI